MMQFGPPRHSRRPSLTPMIDVVFLLLVFFMLAARFGHDLSLPMATGGGGDAYDGPPRLVVIGPTPSPSTDKGSRPRRCPGRCAR